METTIEAVTPQKAQRWLNENKTNRALRSGRVEQYASDMATGRWMQCPEPISFYEDGNLADGQHRLFAIVESGCTIKFNITRGLSRDDGLALNTGLGRSLVDNAKISGSDPGLSNEIVSTARAVEDGDHASAPVLDPETGKRKRLQRSNAARMEIIERHRECVQWAVRNGPRGKLMRNSVTLAAVARAWRREPDRDRLKRFCEVLSTGFYEHPSETAAVALRTYLLQQGPTATIQSNWRDTFLKVQHSIWLFLRGHQLKNVRVVGEEDYPLGNEKRALGSRKRQLKAVA